MASPKQIEANKANAKLSTGPKSKDGKERSRMNSRKHGLTAKMLVIAGENEDDFDQLRADLTDEHDPQSALEAELVERLAGILWRLRRVPFYEAAILDYRGDGIRRRYRDCGVTKQEEDADDEGEETSDLEHSEFIGQCLIADSRHGDGLGKLARHEAALMNAFTKTLQMLLLLQKNGNNRDGRPVMLQRITLPPAA